MQEVEDVATDQLIGFARTEQPARGVVDLHDAVAAVDHDGLGQAGDDGVEALVARPQASAQPGAQPVVVRAVLEREDQARGEVRRFVYGGGTHADPAFRGGGSPPQEGGRGALPGQRLCPKTLKPPRLALEEGGMPRRGPGPDARPVEERASAVVPGDG